MAIDYSCDGCGKMSPGEYGRIRIDGVANCPGDITVTEDIRVDGVMNIKGGMIAKGEVRIDGVLRCDGALTAEKLLLVDGVADFYADVRAEKAEIDGAARIHGGRLEADEILCDGALSVDGEISADVINAEGYIQAEQIVGDKVTIGSHPSFFRKLTGVTLNSSAIKLIEATTVSLRLVKADTVNGRDIEIGEGCEIENLDCSGTLTIHRSARVKNITGDHTRVEK